MDTRHGERWTWSASAHPRVLDVLSTASTHLDWCDALEQSATDAIVGKILCVCAGAAIARSSLSADPVIRPIAVEAVDLLYDWIDEPTDERFDRICSLIFEDRAPPDYNPDPHGVIAWALRIATSSVGNFEAGWALKTTIGAAIEAGLDINNIRTTISQELRSRISSGD